jgi:hypothetical protein
MLIQCDAMTEKECTRCKQLLPISSFTKGPDRGYRYQCRECNNEYQQDPARRKQNSSRYYEKRKLTDPAFFMWRQAKHRAQWDYDGMEFSIMVEHSLIPEKCPYMGVPFIPLDKNYGYSLDRIDSAKGYTPDNIQVVSRLANIMKNNATEEQLIAFAKGVLAVHSKEVCCDVDTM